MHVVQMLLPLYDNAGNKLAAPLFDQVFDELTQEFGGVTAHERAPAEGAWKPPGQGVHRDDVVLFEVMVPDLNRTWWSHYRQTLERRFRQEKLLLRAILAEEL
jgi:hypothetical protein